MKIMGTEYYSKEISHWSDHLPRLWVHFEEGYGNTLLEHFRNYLSEQLGGKDVTVFETKKLRGWNIYEFNTKSNVLPVATADLSSEIAFLKIDIGGGLYTRDKEVLKEYQRRLDALNTTT